MKELKSYNDLLAENEQLRHQLEDASDTIEAIRTGQVDALIVQGKDGHELYTLKTADQTYRVFIEKMTEGAVTLNQAGIILYSNTRFAQMVDRPLSNVLGLHFEDFIAPENKLNFKQLLAGAWEQDCKGEMLLTGANNTLIPFQLSLTTLDLDEGFSMSVILTDLTIQKEHQLKLKLNNEQLATMNHALEISNNDLQQFASVASHDLQEPLRKILIFSSMLREKHFIEMNAELRQYLDKIIYSSNRMKNLVIDILNYSRLSQNNQNFEEVDLNFLITELLDDFEINIQEKKANIQVEKLPVIMANKGQMRQVFQNLISNALKFSNPAKPPHILIKEIESLPVQGHDVKKMRSISISDNGIGFDEKFTPEIFTLFQRLNPKDKYEGTGIGLAITKKIIDKHNGTIKAVSKVGEGAEFIIALPEVQMQNNVEEKVTIG